MIRRAKTKFSIMIHMYLQIYIRLWEAIRKRVIKLTIQIKVSDDDRVRANDAFEEETSNIIDQILNN